MPHPAAESMSDPLQRGMEPFHDEAIVLSPGVPDLDELHLLVGSADHLGEQPGRDGTVERGRDGASEALVTHDGAAAAAMAMAMAMAAGRCRVRLARGGRA